VQIVALVVLVVAPLLVFAAKTEVVVTDVVATIAVLLAVAGLLVNAVLPGVAVLLAVRGESTVPVTAATNSAARAVVFRSGAVTATDCVATHRVVHPKHCRSQLPG